MLWNLIQQAQISEHHDNTLSLERRVKKLEKELHSTKESLHNLTIILETKFGEGLSNIPDATPAAPESQINAGQIKTKTNHSLKTRDQILKENILHARQKRNRH